MQTIAIVLCGLAVGGLSFLMLHIYQLEGYVPKQYCGWLRQNTGRVYACAAVWLTVGAAVLTRFCPLSWISLIVSALACAYAWVYALAQTRGEKVKKKLDFTKRMRRLALVTLLVVLVLLLAGLAEPLILAGAGALFWAVVLAAVYLIAPVEK